MYNPDLIPDNEEQAAKLSNAELIAIEIVVPAKAIDHCPRYIVRTMRLKPGVVFTIEALAKETGWTIQETTNRLLEAGADAVKAAVAAHDPELARKLYRLSSAAVEVLESEEVAQ